MDAPLGITFLKKVELYNEARRLEKGYEEKPRNSLWPTEKAILKWTWRGHRHLGSSITTDHLSRGSTHNKLKDFGMLDKKGELKPEFKVLETIKLQQPLENLVVRGYAEYSDLINSGHNHITISKEGLLFGNMLNEIEKGDRITKFNYKIYSVIMGQVGALILFFVFIIGLYYFLAPLFKSFCK
jgi:hypothetical protein